MVYGSFATELKVQEMRMRMAEVKDRNKYTVTANVVFGNRYI